MTASAWRASSGSCGLDAATPAEVTLWEKTLDTVTVRRTGQPGRPRKRPERLVADRAFDQQQSLAEAAEAAGDAADRPIIPARKNHRRATDQDGRKLRRYKIRWIVERTFA